MILAADDRAADPKGGAARALSKIEDVRSESPLYLPLRRRARVYIEGSWRWEYERQA